MVTEEPRSGDPGRGEVVVVTEPLAPGPLAWLRERASVVERAPGEPGFEGALARAAALVVRTRTRVDRALLHGAPGLRVVGRAGVGLDNVDVPGCRARGIAVVHTPGANTGAVVEFVWAEVLDAMRPRAAVVAPMDARQWEGARASGTAARELGGLTLGVYGLGRIGRGVARVGAAFGMKVVFCDLLDLAQDRCDRVSGEELLRIADVVSIHVDGREENRGLIGARELEMLKHDALVVNTARGFVVDERALAAWLAAHPAARAVLDVHEREPVDAGHPLLGVGNARLTAHVAAATAPAKERMSWVVRDVWEALCATR